MRRKGLEGSIVRFAFTEHGITFVEVLIVVLIIGVLFLIALRDYFGTEGGFRAKRDAKQAVDRANVHAINSALALYKLRNNGACPADAAALTGSAFFGTVTYFRDGIPLDPWTNTATPYAATYVAAECRVRMRLGGINHAAITTGPGHP